MASGTQESVGHPQVAHEKPALLQFDPGIGIWTLVAFLSLLVLLKRFAWKPILASIDARDQKIQDALQRAERIQSESEDHRAQQLRILQDAQEQAAKIIGDSRRNAETIRERLLETAHSEKSKIVRSATDEIESIKLEIKSELRQFSAELAVNTAEKILHDQLDRAKAKQVASRMVQDFQP